MQKYLKYGQRDSTLHPKYILDKCCLDPHCKGAIKILFSSEYIFISAARINSEIFLMKNLYAESRLSK